MNCSSNPGRRLYQFGCEQSHGELSIASCTSMVSLGSTDANRLVRHGWSVCPLVAAFGPFADSRSSTHSGHSLFREADGPSRLRGVAILTSRARTTARSAGRTL